MDFAPAACWVWRFDDGRLFHDYYGAGAFDALVADVHTDVPNIAPPDPGSMLHQAVGRVIFLMLAAESGGDRFICAGPVLSDDDFR